RPGQRVLLSFPAQLSPTQSRRLGARGALQLPKPPQRPAEKAGEHGDREHVGNDEVRHGAILGSGAVITFTSSAMCIRSSLRVSILYRIAISTAASASVQAIVSRKVASISGGSASLTTTGPGCCVLHQVTLKWTTGTSTKPKIPTTAAMRAAWRPGAARRRTRR